MDACRNKAHALHMGYMYMHVLFIMIITGENILQYSQAYSEIVAILRRTVEYFSSLGGCSSLDCQMAQLALV